MKCELCSSSHQEAEQKLCRPCIEAVSLEHLSAIRNWVCPECGGRMGGRSKEFQCQGRCGRDWRAVWESVFDSRRKLARWAGRAS